MDPTSDHPCVEETIALIHEVFADVRRGNGTSWEESKLHDQYEYGKKQNAAARAIDPIDRWQDLLEPGSWQPDECYGGFAFLDAEGARFYLPAAMILGLQRRLDITFFLTSEQCQDRWATLTDTERGCVARFLRCLMDRDETWDLTAEYMEFWKAYETPPR